jgi:hypothetical protein
MIQLRHVPSNWLMHSRPVGPGLTKTIALLRRAAERRGYIVEDGVTVEDWNPKIRGMLRS